MPLSRATRRDKGLRRRRGFSLVEILVVVGIVVLLVAILLPVISSVKASSRTSVCSSNLRQLGQAIELYSQDNDHYPRGLDPADKFTSLWNGSYMVSTDTLNTTPILATVLSSYVRNDALWSCPADSGFDTIESSGEALDARPSCYEKFRMSYFYRTELTFLDLSQEHLLRPAETNVLFDGNGSWHGTIDSKRYNVLFADSHVKNINDAAFADAWQISLKEN